MSRGRKERSEKKEAGASKSEHVLAGKQVQQEKAISEKNKIEGEIGLSVPTTGLMAVKRVKAGKEYSLRCLGGIEHGLH